MVSCQSNPIGLYFIPNKYVIQHIDDFIMIFFYPYKY